MSRSSNRQRTSLFDQPQRVQSPYERPSQRDLSASELEQMESQSEEQQNIMFGKIASLRSLSEKMGVEIRAGNQTIENLEDTFGKIQQTLKRTWTKMMVMAQQSTIPLKTWFLFFGAIFFVFFIIWIT
ncbi:CYFA0S04e01090g1_1 [Cyberlindnera fabianii]|uniref:CYFA0S04e01090g1_1 n=1 Tax=Cyberlindnera fabianii TaxID=36022 RepID=A0A061AR24_CYBFA|nr:CYFA0S04e01090g1_1 [Cyberlindnera fabianii]